MVIGRLRDETEDLIGKNTIAQAEACALHV
jgi:hypothetical protein